MLDLIRIEVQHDTQTEERTAHRSADRQSEPRECATASLLRTYCQSQHLEAVNTHSHTYALKLSVSLTPTRPSSTPPSSSTASSSLSLCQVYSLGGPDRSVQLKRDSSGWGFSGFSHISVPLSALWRYWFLFLETTKHKCKCAHIAVWIFHLFQEKWLNIRQNDSLKLFYSLKLCFYHSHNHCTNVLTKRPCWETWTHCKMMNQSFDSSVNLWWIITVNRRLQHLSVPLNVFI